MRIIEILSNFLISKQDNMSLLINLEFIGFKVLSVFVVPSCKVQTLLYATRRCIVLFPIVCVCLLHHKFGSMWLNFKIYYGSWLVETSFEHQCDVGFWIGSQSQKQFLQVISYQPIF